MRRRLLDLLACPGCGGALAPDGSDGAEEIEAGALGCVGCRRSFPVVRGIPRFVEPGNYAASFGLQWNRFAAEQLDSKNGTAISSHRFFSETGWSRDWLDGKWVLDGGCGAGRFLDVAADSGAEVVGVDLSNAVDAAAANLAGRRNVHLVQASLYELPFRRGVFDGCYCIGVVQHTPDPLRTVASLPPLLKPGGRLALTIYERRRFTRLNAKYLVRPFTRRVDKQRLLRALELTMPAIFPATEVLFRLPLLGKLFQFGIPVANYVQDRRLTRQQRFEWALMDTFDMLAPAYDQPQRQADVERALEHAGIVSVERRATGGLNLVGRKAP